MRRLRPGDRLGYRPHHQTGIQPLAVAEIDAPVQMWAGDPPGSTDCANQLNLGKALTTSLATSQATLLASFDITFEQQSQLAGRLTLAGGRATR